MISSGVPQGGLLGPMLLFCNFPTNILVAVITKIYATQNAIKIVLKYFQPLSAS